MSNNKQLKDKYKLKKFRIGVFQIRNIVNGKVFVDSSLNLDAIWNRVSVELRYGSYRNVELQNEWKEFGEENFRYEILSEIEQDNDKTDHNIEAKKLADMFIDELQPFDDRGYNRRPKTNA